VVFFTFCLDAKSIRQLADKAIRSASAKATSDAVRYIPLVRSLLVIKIEGLKALHSSSCYSRFPGGAVLR